jgi:hypothetical protein
VSAAVAFRQTRPEDLAEAIEREHQAANDAARTAIEHLIRCGELLIEAKKAVPHGEWLPWIRANLSFCPRQAQKYMRLAEHADHLRNTNPGSHLTINQALAMLADGRSYRDCITGNGEIYTSQQVLERARQVFGGQIDLDPASSDRAQETVQARTYHTKEQNGLTEPWLGRVFLNPPYDCTGKFITKLLLELAAGRASEAIVLVHSYTGPEWFHQAATRCAAICFTLGRLPFKNDAGTTQKASFGSAIVYFGDHLDRFREVFGQIGIIMLPAGAAP